MDDHGERQEDALSLSDIPLRTSSDRRRSSSEPSDFFEFFNGFAMHAEMSHAEDIIFRGKLVPYRSHPQILKSLSADDATRFSKRAMFPTPIGSDSRRPPRSRRDLDLARSDDILRSFSNGSSRSDVSSRASRPRWFFLMSGPLKMIQPEIDLRDIKSRRGRRRPGRMFPGTDIAGGEIPARQKSFWSFDLLGILSCKSSASVAVTASVGLAQRF